MPAATEAPLRTCPHCGFEERSTRERCTRCGRSVLVRAPRLRGRRRTYVIWGGAAAAVVIVAIIALVLNDIVSDRDKRESADAKKAVAAEKARLKVIQAPHRASAVELRPAADASEQTVLNARAALVRDAEASITRDAQARDRAGELKGPISRTECGPLLKAKDAVPDDRILTKSIGRYDCVAVKRNVAG